MMIMRGRLMTAALSSFFYCTGATTPPPQDETTSILYHFPTTLLLLLVVFLFTIVVVINTTVLVITRRTFLGAVGATISCSCCCSFPPPGCTSRRSRGTAKNAAAAAAAAAASPRFCCCCSPPAPPPGAAAPPTRITTGSGCRRSTMRKITSGTTGATSRRGGSRSSGVGAMMKSSNHSMLLLLVNNICFFLVAAVLPLVVRSCGSSSYSSTFFAAAAAAAPAAASSRMASSIFSKYKNHHTNNPRHSLLLGHDHHQLGGDQGEEGEERTTTRSSLSLLRITILKFNVISRAGGRSSSNPPPVSDHGDAGTGRASSASSLLPLVFKDDHSLLFRAPAPAESSHHAAPSPADEEHQGGQIHNDNHHRHFTNKIKTTFRGSSIGAVPASTKEEHQQEGGGGKNDEDEGSGGRRGRAASSRQGGARPPPPPVGFVAAADDPQHQNKEIMMRSILIPSLPPPPWVDSNLGSRAIFFPNVTADNCQIPLKKLRGMHKQCHQVGKKKAKNSSATGVVLEDHSILLLPTRAAVLLPSPPPSLSYHHMIMVSITESDYNYSLYSSSSCLLYDHYRTDHPQHHGGRHESSNNKKGEFFYDSNHNNEDEAEEDDHTTMNNKKIIKYRGGGGGGGGPRPPPPSLQLINPSTGRVNGQGGFRSLAKKVLGGVHQQTKGDEATKNRDTNNRNYNKNMTILLPGNDSRTNNPRHSRSKPPPPPLYHSTRLPFEDDGYHDHHSSPKKHQKILSSCAFEALGFIRLSWRGDGGGDIKIHQEKGGRMVGGVRRNHQLYKEKKTSTKTTRKNLIDHIIDRADGGEDEDSAWLGRCNNNTTNTHSRSRLLHKMTISKLDRGKMPITGMGELRILNQKHSKTRMGGRPRSKQIPSRERKKKNHHRGNKRPPTRTPIESQKSAADGSSPNNKKQDHHKQIVTTRSTPPVKFRCFYRVQYDNWRGEFDYTSPDFWPVLIYCPSVSSSLCKKVEQYHGKEKHIKIKLFTPISLLGTHEQSSGAFSTTTTTSSTILRDHYSSSPSTSRRRRTGTFGAPPPYISEFDFKFPGAGDHDTAADEKEHRNQPINDTTYKMQNIKKCTKNDNYFQPPRPTFHNTKKPEDDHSSVNFLVEEPREQWNEKSLPAADPSPGEKKDVAILKNFEHNNSAFTNSIDITTVIMETKGIKQKTMVRINRQRRVKPTKERNTTSMAFRKQGNYDVKKWAVCLTIPYETSDPQKMVANGALLFEWVRYYAGILNAKVLIYDYGGNNFEHIYGRDEYGSHQLAIDDEDTDESNIKSSSKNQKKQEHPSLSSSNIDHSKSLLLEYQQNIVYHNFTMLSVLRPSLSRKHRKDDMSSHGGFLSKNLYIMDTDKSLTSTHCRFEADSVFGINRVLVVDFDEFLYCPLRNSRLTQKANKLYKSSNLITSKMTTGTVSSRYSYRPPNILREREVSSVHAKIKNDRNNYPSSIGLARYINSKFSDFRNKNIDQVTMMQVVVANKTSNTKDCAIMKIKTNQSILDCFAPYEFMMRMHDVKSFHLSMKCPVTTHHHACNNYDRKYNCQCNSVQLHKNECGIVHLTLNPHSYRKYTTPLALSDYQNKTMEIKTLIDNFFGDTNQ